MQLQHAPLAAYREADKLPGMERIAAYAALNRLNALYMIQKAGSGHIGSTFSSMDIITWMMLQHPEITFFSSKGHDCPAFYANLIALGKLPFEMIHQLRRVGGLPGHPELWTPGIAAHSGSLGMGISKAKGLIRANRLRGITQRVAVLLGDGELQEGQIWEAIYSGNDFPECLVIVDANGMSTERQIRNTYSPIWQQINGHRFEEFEPILGVTSAVITIAVANTIKGKGISFMERQAKYHSGALSVEEYDAALLELQATIRQYLPDVWYEAVNIRARDRKPGNELMMAYEKALLYEGLNDQVIVLDADLALDCGLGAFRERYPGRFIECGIAEQDMASQAGMLAARGFIPIVHSFAAFLTRRANEQIYDSCHQGLKVIYVGSLAGRLPDGPGPSHEALDDVALMRTMPNIEIFEPKTPDEVAGVLYYAVNQAEHPVYIRLAANPIEGSRR